VRCSVWDLVMRHKPRDDYLQIGLELFEWLPEGRKRKINWLKLFRIKTGLSHKEALDYYEKVKRIYYRLHRE